MRSLSFPIPSLGISLVNILSALSYALCSILILVTNKTVLSVYKFNFPVLMTLVHMVVSIVCLRAFRSLGLLHFSDFNLSLARRISPLSICFVLNIISGMCGLRLTNIPIFATLRRLTVLFVLISEYVVLGKRPLPLVIVAVATMISGSFIAGWGDLQFDLIGYLYVLLNNVITSLYLVLMKKIIQETALHSDTWGVMYYNATLSLPFLLVLSYVNGELTSVIDYPKLNDPNFQLAFCISSIVAFGVNYSIFWCTEKNSALTTSVTGQVKNVLSSFISIVGPGANVPATKELVAGLTVGLMGSFIYAYATGKANAIGGSKHAEGESAKTVNETEKESDEEERLIDKKNPKDVDGHSRKHMNEHVNSSSASSTSESDDVNFVEGELEVAIQSPPPSSASAMTSGGTQAFKASQRV